MKHFFRAIGGGLARFFKAIGRGIARHKGLSVFFLVLVLGALAAYIILSRMQPQAAAGGFSMPENTRLAKMDLELTVTATGTLQSADTREVSSTLSYDIKEVQVAVGDSVQEGQVLCTLDDTDLNKAIADVRADIAETEASDALALEQLERKLQDAINQQAIDDERLNSEVTDAETAITTATDERDEAEQDMKDKKALSKQADKDVASYPPEGDAAHDAAEYNRLTQAAKEAQSAYEAAAQAYESKSAAIDQAQSAYETALQQRDSTLRQDSLSIENARDSINNQKVKNSTRDLREQLQEYLDQRDELTITAPMAGVVTAVNATAGSSAGGSGGATGSAGAAEGGASTTATAGSGLFTIEDTGDLEIEVAVAEYDALGITKGMAATITTDALEDESWSASVTSVSPTVSDGYFTVTLGLGAPAGQLAVGMSATVDIITDSRADVYAVPYDAVVTNSDGQTVVYALDMGAFGGDMPGDAGQSALPESGAGNAARPEGIPAEMPAFGGASGEDGGPAENRTEIVVETGLETDYYIEISGDGLRDGLMILNDPLGNNTTAAPAEESVSGGLSGFGGMGGGMPPGGSGGGERGGGGMPGGGPPA